MSTATRRPAELPRRCDVLVTGGGPAGATAAIARARAGLEVLVVERARVPRFHVGLSLLPRRPQAHLHRPADHAPQGHPFATFAEPQR